MKDIICVTQRSLCDDFLTQIDKIAASNIHHIVLREKDLSESEYESLAREVLKICKRHSMPLYCNTYFAVADRIGADGIHLPLNVALENEYPKQLCLGISTHSVSDALKAQALNADYITYGHVFATDCKKGLAPRGTAALREVCNAVKLPVYAIGGITVQNSDETINVGAAGICLMSSLMKSNNPQKLISDFNFT
jgi:thiamine-phosphate pyrophosphorylase